MMHGTKRLKIASTELPADIDWKKCCLCQEITREKLIEPSLNNDLSQRSKSYETVTRNVQQFVDMGELSPIIPFHQLSEGEGMLKNLINKKAKWHKSCALFVAPSKLERVKKKIAAKPSDTSHNDDTPDSRFSYNALSPPTCEYF